MKTAIQYLEIKKHNLKVEERVWSKQENSDEAIISVINEEIRDIENALIILKNGGKF